MWGGRRRLGGEGRANSCGSGVFYVGVKEARWSAEKHGFVMGGWSAVVVDSGRGSARAGVGLMSSRHSSGGYGRGVLDCICPWWDYPRDEVCGID